jgi:outer membrane protein OmpA-like peptidoglycan-associated protein
MKKILLFFALAGCVYVTPPHDEWPTVLHGTSFDPMTPTLKVAKKPLYQADGGFVIAQADKTKYMADLESKLDNTLRKPGIQISRVGTDVVVVMVRSAFIYTDSPEISEMGDDLLGDLASVLKEFNATWIELTGYTDEMQNQENAVALSRDMATRVALYLSKNGIRPIRIFVNGRGSANPIADQSDIGRLMNLRVEVKLSVI